MQYFKLHPAQLLLLRRPFYLGWNIGQNCMWKLSPKSPFWPPEEYGIFLMELSKSENTIPCPNLSKTKLLARWNWFFLYEWTESAVSKWNHEKLMKSQKYSHLFLLDELDSLPPWKSCLRWGSCPPDPVDKLDRLNNPGGEKCDIWLKNVQAINFVFKAQLMCCFKRL